MHKLIIRNFQIIALKIKSMITELLVELVKLVLGNFQNMLIQKN